MMEKIRCVMLLLAVLTLLHSTGVAQETDSATDEQQAGKSTDEITAEIFRRAARNGDLETVKRGIEAGIEIDSPSAYGATALFFACDRGHAEVVTYLLEKGADPNAKDSFYNATPVTWSLMQENQDITLDLIKNGGDFEQVLVNAIAGGDDELATKIIELRPGDKDPLVKARDTALRIKDEDQQKKMLALFDSLELPEPVEFEFSKETRDALVGKFTSEAVSVEITIEEEKPMINFGGGSTEIIPSSETEFTVGSGEASFEIADGKIEAIDITFGANTFNLKRANSDAEETTAKFELSSPESLAADSKVSSANWPGFRGVGSRGVAEGQKPPISFHVAAAIEEADDSDDSNADSGDESEATESTEDESASGEEVSDDEKPVESKSTDASDASEETQEAEATEQEESADQTDEPEEESQPRESEMLLWQAPVEGLGLSSPTVWEDKIFITTAVTEGDAGELRIGLFGDVDSIEETQEYEFKLLCYSKATGEKLWERIANKALPAVKRHSKSSHANSTVATDGKHVVAFFGSEGLYCYSMEGDLLWNCDLGYLDSGWFYDKDYQWGFASSPTIHKGKLYVQCDIQDGSFLACMDLKDGNELWRSEREEIPTWSSPIVHEFDGKAMVITNGTKSSRGYDAETGKVLWNMKGNSEIVVPTPNVAHNMIFISSGYAPIRPVYAITPDATGDISLEDNQKSNDSVVWSNKNGGPYMPTPIIYGDYLYCCANAGILTCYEAKTGKRVYKKRLQGKGQLAFTASPVAADGHLYFTAEDGQVLVVKAGPKFEIVTNNELNQSILATPAISEGVMFFRTQSNLIAVGQRITD